MQRLYVGNLRAGQHELVALFTGKGPNERDYRRGASLKFEKGVGAKYLELKISDRARTPAARVRDQGLGVARRCADAVALACGLLCAVLLAPCGCALHRQREPD